MSDHGGQDVGHFPVQQGSPWCRDYEGCLLHVCCMCCMNGLRGVIGIKTRLRKIMSGEDSAMRSARGHTSGYFQAAKDCRIIPATELGHRCQQSKQQTGAKKQCPGNLRSQRTTYSRSSTLSCCYKVPFSSYILMHVGQRSRGEVAI